MCTSKCTSCLTLDCKKMKEKLFFFLNYQKKVCHIFFLNCRTWCTYWIINLFSYMLSFLRKLTAINKDLKRVKILMEILKIGVQEENLKVHIFKQAIIINLSIWFSIWYIIHSSRALRKFVCKLIRFQMIFSPSYAA